MILGNVSFSVQPTQAPPLDDSLFLCFQPGKALLSADNGTPAMPTLGRMKPLLPESVRPFQLAHAEGRGVFCPDPLLPAQIQEGDGLFYQSIRAFHAMPFAQGGILTSAYHLWCWYQKNRFCGVCGQKLTHCREERALRCPGCGELFFPMIAPAVIVAITCGEEILLARNVKSELNHYALIAGYVEVGETLEHAVAREVREEVGLEVRDLTYLGDQPWGISGSLMFAFHAHADRNAPITLQQSEIADAKWVRRETLEANEKPVSIAAELIERYRAGRL